jgi:hypothetical protein
LNTHLGPHASYGEYKTKLKATSEEIANINLHPHKLFPEWNYTIRPYSN